MRKALFFFGILDDEDTEWMISVGSRRDLKPGDELIHEGLPLDAMFLVLDGMLGVTVGAREVARLQAGEIVGEMSFVDARPPSASVSALERSMVLSIPRRQLSERLAENPSFGVRFYRALAVFLADRLRATVGQLGYGKNQPTQREIEERDELDPEVLENLSLATTRFDKLLRRMRGSNL